MSSVLSDALALPSGGRDMAETQNRERVRLSKARTQPATLQGIPMQNQQRAMPLIWNIVRKERRTHSRPAATTPWSRARRRRALTAAASIRRILGKSPCGTDGGMGGQQLLEVPAAAIPADHQVCLMTGHQEFGSVSAIKALKLINRHVFSLLPLPFHIWRIGQRQFSIEVCLDSLPHGSLGVVGHLDLSCVHRLKRIGPTKPCK